MKDCRFCKEKNCEGCESNVKDTTCRSCGKEAMPGSFFCEECKDNIGIEQFEASCSSAEMCGMSRFAKGVYIGLSKDGNSVVYDPLNGDAQNSIFFGSPKGGTSLHIKS